MTSSTVLDTFSEILDYQDASWEALQGSTVLVTGATGLVGSSTVLSILKLNEALDQPIRVVAFVRNQEKAEDLFGANTPNLGIVRGQIEEPLNIQEPVDYIIHAAAITSSALMSSQPVEVINSTLNGTRQVLEFARETKVKKLVYLSSMEIYGSSDGTPITEADYWTVDPMLVRSCYPEAKKMAECYCSSYWAEYGVPAVSARLAQTFGPGVKESDKRVFAYFARCAKYGEDIVLRTAGTSSSVYVYTIEAVAALLTLLVKGEPGNAYNVANPNTYCTIYEMAELVRDNIAVKPIEIRIEQDSSIVYPPEHHWNLDVSKIKTLGWEPKKTLVEMYTSMVDFV